MSEQDNFEDLSNAEIRSKCIQYGLPNIPVTDSSRKILIKKLRVSIGGGGVGSGVGSNLPAAVAASPKKQNRRETINAAAKQTSEIKSSDNNATNNLDAKDNQQRNKGRRPSENTAKESSMQSTNAPTTNDKLDIRGVKVNLAKSSLVPTKVEEKKPPPQTRRKSVQPEEIGSQRTNVSRIPQRREPIQEDEETTKTTSSLKPIEERRKSVEKPLPPTQRASAANPSMPLIKENKVLLSNSLIVLESDEEEDAQLARAVRNVEDNLQKRNVNQQKHEQESQLQKQQQTQIPKQKLAVAIGSSSAASALYNSELYQNAMYGGSSVTKELSGAAQQLPITSIGTQLSKETDTPITSIGTKSTLYSSGLSQVPSTSSGISSSNLSAATAERYTIGSFSSPLQQRFTTLATSGITMASSPYPVDNQKRPPTLVSANEFSDDPDGAEIDPLSSPYLSKFARSLERLKSTPITERSSFRSGTPRNRRTVAIGSSYEPEVRRPLRSEDIEVSGALMNFLQTLDRKYQLKSKMIIVFAIVSIIIIYVLFF